MSSGKKKKNKKIRNKSRDFFTDYYQTGKRFDKENRQRRQEEGTSEPRGLKNLNSFEWCCIVVIVLGLIGCLIRYVIL